MSSVVLTHGVGDMTKWLSGESARKAIFANFCSSYRAFCDPAQSRVILVLENVDMAKFEVAAKHPDAARAEAEFTVLQPVELFVELPDNSSRTMPTHQKGAET
jgi:hypothetical protein